MSTTTVASSNLQQAHARYGIARSVVEPYSLRDAPSLIERLLSAQKISAEAQKERKAGAGQTLTALGSYWKGRKPLILVRACVLGALLPASDDAEKDLAIFEKLMAIDDEAFLTRAQGLSARAILERLHLDDLCTHFALSNQSGELPTSAPVDFAAYLGLTVRWKKGITEAQKTWLQRQALAAMSYSEKLACSKRPEEIEGVLYGTIWDAVNAHLGTHAHNHTELVEQLGIMRFGHRPKVADTFCGGGSIPFEAARLGCDVYASDLNPIACMLTWGALNIIGANDATRTEIENAQKKVAEAVDREITKLGIEHDQNGHRAKAYLYCLETCCPETGWMIPMAPSWVISKTHRVYAKLVPNRAERRFDIEIVSGASAAEMKIAEKGTVQDGYLCYELDGELHRTAIKTIRDDYTKPDGSTGNRLRLWGKSDFKPRLDDIFQERLYCIQWRCSRYNKAKKKVETWTEFRSVTAEDLAREAKVEALVAKNLSRWQEEGLVPDMLIEPGYNTDQPIRERGWTHWHHLFNARQLQMLATYRKIGTRHGEQVTVGALAISFAKAIDWNSKLCRWDSSLGHDCLTNVFSNQALNTLYTFGHRGHTYFSNHTTGAYAGEHLVGRGTVVTEDAGITADFASDIFVTDPP